MCRGRNGCSELGIEPANWDQNCPLRPLEWIDGEISKFIQALDLFIKGSRESCIEVLLTIRNQEITDWYIEHGQMAGMHRTNFLDIPKPVAIPDNLRDPIRAPKKYQTEVFNRDQYHCRYCGAKLISQKLIKSFISALNSEHFMRGSTNLTTHGIIHATWPVADHVIPWNLGGRTDLTNLVASCAACNYGKAGYTCEQMGISDPFTRPPIHDGWDGLVSKQVNIKRIV